MKPCGSHDRASGLSFEARKHMLARTCPKVQRDGRNPVPEFYYRCGYEQSMMDVEALIVGLRNAITTGQIVSDPGVFAALNRVFKQFNLQLLEMAVLPVAETDPNFIGARSSGSPFYTSSVTVVRKGSGPYPDPASVHESLIGEAVAEDSVSHNQWDETHHHQPRDASFIDELVKDYKPHIDT